jgi:hypothetical protein
MEHATSMQRRERIEHVERDVHGIAHR